MTNSAHKDVQVANVVRDILVDLSGFEVDDSSASTSFLELGFDSLFLIQFSTSLKRALQVEVSFRQMLEDTSTFESLVGYVADHVSDDVLPEVNTEIAETATSGGQEVLSQPSNPAVSAGLPSAPSSTQSQNGYANGSSNPNGPTQADLVQYAQPPQPAAAVPILSAPAQPVQVAPTSVASVGQPLGLSGAVPASPADANGLEAIMAQQLQVMSMQLAALSGQGIQAAPAQPAIAPEQATITQTNAIEPVAPSVVTPATENGTSAAANQNRATDSSSAVQDSPAKKSDPSSANNNADNLPKTSHEMKPFGAIARIQVAKGDELLPQQQAWLDDFVQGYNEMTAKSKEFTAQYQGVHADPRVVSGFKSKIKELIYPIVAERTNGCRIWDVDGNEYIDALNGFGSNFFGYANPEITQAVVDQMWRGVEIGPQCPLTGETAELICEFTGMDRVGFCNTGSEAVMGAMRIARTVTGRETIVIFSGSYHGIFDEVIVRSTPGLRSMPAAPGIMRSSVQNVLVLEYGTEESLQIIRDRIDEFAAVMVESVQSRRPEFQPTEFLQELRTITEENDVPFIFDEVITGFRTGPGGAQEFFGIQADIATYGKVVGGGMHIGVVAGKAKYMDALDGGPWSYGDDSVPEVGVTYFAGTFVRHPASIAACRAALQILKREGPELQQRVNAQTAYLASELNNFFTDQGVPLEINYFSSLWRMTYTENISYGEVLFYLIRKKGVHIYDGFPCFITMAHTDEDVEAILSAVRASIAELQEAGFLPKKADDVAQTDFFAQAS